MAAQDAASVAPPLPPDVPAPAPAAVPRRGYKIVNLDYTPFCGARDGKKIVYHVGTRHALPAGTLAWPCRHGFHYCREALHCLQFVCKVDDFAAHYRLLRVVDESPHGTQTFVWSDHKIAAWQLYIEGEVTDADERRRLLTGTTPCINGFVCRYVDGVRSGCGGADDDDDSTDASATEIGYDVFMGAMLTRTWYRRNVLHRSGDRPASVIYYTNGKIRMEVWYDGDGMPHRDGDLPAIKMRHENGTPSLEKWLQHGCAHRDRSNGPAMVMWDETGAVRHQAWYTRGITCGDGREPTVVTYAPNGLCLTLYHDKSGTEVKRTTTSVAGATRT